MREEDVEPLQSRFTLSYNTVLNLVKGYDEEGIASVLSRNFARFQADEARKRYEAEAARLEQIRVQLLGGADERVVERLLQYRQYKRDLERLYEKIRRQERSKEYRGLKELRLEAKRLRRQIGRLERAGVSRASEDIKGSALKEYAKVRDRLEATKEALAALPTPDAFMEEFTTKRQLLEAMDYIREGELTARGLFAAQINGSELLITELFFRGVFHDWTEDALNALAACMGYEPRRGEERQRHDAFDLGPVRRSLILIQEMERVYLGHSDLEFNDHLAQAARLWSEGAAFLEVLKVSGVDEGDLVFAFRRAIDVIRQVRQAARQDEMMAAKLTRCIDRMDRDEVSILL